MVPKHSLLLTGVQNVDRNIEGGGGGVNNGKYEGGFDYIQRGTNQILLVLVKWDEILIVVGT